MCLLAVAFYFFVLYIDVSKHVVYIGIRLMGLLAVPSFFSFYTYMF